VILALAWSCAREPALIEAPPTPWAQHECDRCHAAEPTFAAASPERSCVGCHQEILAGGYDDAALPERVARWKQHLHRMNAVPDLGRAAERLTRDWFVAYLTDPVDLRPHLPAEMPLLPVDVAEAEALADLLGLPPLPSASGPSPGDPARGLALIGARCAACHAVSGQGGGAPLALDLAFVARRSTPEQVDRWLADPAALIPNTPMPDPVSPGRSAPTWSRPCSPPCRRRPARPCRSAPRRRIDR
jgi:mono/diheme cytochrome c family protein